jgi:PAT family beta-lactamase induction signal transducer AmpG
MSTRLRSPREPEKAEPSAVDERYAPPVEDTRDRRLFEPITWVPSLYFASAIPFAMAVFVAATMLKDLGHSDGEITWLTGSLGIVWALKPLWVSFLEMYRTKRFFVLAMEGSLSLLLAGIALALGSRATSRSSSSCSG